MARLSKVAALLRGEGYYGLIILHSKRIFFGTPQCNLMHTFRLYHPGMMERRGWVFEIEKSLTFILHEILSADEFLQSRRQNTHWSPNRFGIPIAPTGHILPMWCDVAYEMPVAGTAPANPGYVIVKYPVPVPLQDEYAFLHNDPPYDTPGVLYQLPEE